MGDVLRELDEELKGRETLPKPAIAKLNYSHEAMIDLIIQAPGISQNELAAHFGYTPAWICQIIASDAFQAQLANRREQLIDPAIRLTIEERFRALVTRSLDILQEKLAMPAHQIPDNLALRTVELSAKALGFGAKPDPVAPPPAHNHLEQLGENLVKLLDHHKRRVLDGQEIVEAEIVAPKES